MSGNPGKDTIPATVSREISKNTYKQTHSLFLGLHWKSYHSCSHLPQTMLQKRTAAWGSLREAASVPLLLCTLSGGLHERILSSPFHSTESTVKPTPVHLPLKGVVSSDDSGQRTHSQGLEVGIGTSAGKALIEARPPGFRFAHVEC